MNVDTLGLNTKEKKKGEQSCVQFDLFEPETKRDGILDSLDFRYGNSLDEVNRGDSDLHVMTHPPLVQGADRSRCGDG